MNKQEYLNWLEHYLKKLNPTERADAMQYYREYFEESGPENEQAVVEELGDPKRLAAKICAESALKSIDNNPKNGMKALWIGLGALFMIPIGLPLAIVLFVLLFVLLIALFAILFALLLVTVVLFAVGMALLVACVPAMFLSIPGGLVVLGAALCLLPISILMGLALFLISRFIICLIARGLNRRVARGEYQ